ncbi:uncharacterized protein [Solanum lycopersicum]|uniref:uncharacterized protein n=1 Tax=Solanum lycopersicum TaxID=4081 RepID=UPI003748CAC1
MRATDTKKAELASYQLKDVAQTWCKMWQDSQVLGGVPATWEMFQTTFMERFFPREIRESKDEEFINLKQGSMTVREYSLKFVKQSMDEMSRFLTGINEDMEEECRSTVLHNNMDLSRLMVHVQQVEDNRKKRGVRYVRRRRPQDQAGPSHGSHRNNFGVREQPRFKKGQQSSGNSNPQRSTSPRRGRPEPKEGNGGEMQRPKKHYAKCGRAYWEECRHETNVCFGCGCCSSEPSKRNMFYVLKGKEEQEKSADLVTGILQVFPTSVYDLLNPRSTLSFVTPLLSLTFEILPEVLHDLIVVSTPLGENVRTDRVYKDCPIVVSVTFQVHVVPDQGVKVDPKKTKVVKNWPQPLTPTVIRSFLGLADYYRRFVEGFSSIAAPLTALMKKKAKFEWTEIVHEKDHPTHDLELAAVVFPLKLWIRYLYRVHMDVFTYHKTLQYVFTQRELNLCQRRWLELLKDYDINVHYHPGKANVVADALIKMSIGSTTYIEDEKKKLAKKVHRLGVRLVDSTSRGVSVYHRSESSLVVEVKKG